MPRRAVELGAEGVGLFRTEFLFLDSTTAPTVEEQQEQYTELLSHFPGKKVVVRALDAGADKPLSFLNDAHEENPALGLRGLRALRASEQILRDQLTALKGAQDATEADLWVMAPMVADAEETEYFVEARQGARAATVGVMAEVPSLAVLADQVLEVTDFVSASAPTTSPSTRSRPTACSARVAALPGPVASGGAAPGQAARRRGRRGGQAGRASAARRRPTRSSPSCSSGSARRRLDDARRARRRARRARDGDARAGAREGEGRRRLAAATAAERARPAAAAA